jgi:hypothetical protein
LDLKRAFVDATVHDAIKSGAALIEERRRSKVRIARVNGRATWQQRMCECAATVILQRTKQRIGVDLIAGAI